MEWKVNKSQRRCAVTARVLEVGETFFSALKEEGESFVRYDYSEAAWNDLGKEEFFSYWKTHIPSKDQQRKNKLKIDSEAFYTFFSNLHRQTKPKNQLFLYLLGLILIRKRILRLEEIEKSPDGEGLIIYDTRSKEEIRIAVPEVTEAALAGARQELEDIFECNTDD